MMIYSLQQIDSIALADDVRGGLTKKKKKHNGSEKRQKNNIYSNIHLLI